MVGVDVELSGVLFVELPLLVPVSGLVPPVLLDPLLEPLGAVLLPLLSGVVLWVPFCCWLELELGLLIVPLGWVLSVPWPELY